MKKTVAWILILALALCLGAAGAENSGAEAVETEGLYASVQR